MSNNYLELMIMARISPEYKKDMQNVDNINSKLQFISIDDYDLDKNYEYNSNLPVEENIARKFILKKKGRDLKEDKKYELAIKHQLSLLENSYFVNDYYPYRHLTIKYELTKQYEKMTDIIKKFFRSHIYAHHRHVDWFLYKLIFLEQSNYITNDEIDSLVSYYDAHGALNKPEEHKPIFIADRIFQRKNGDIKLDNQYNYEKQEEKYALKEKGSYLERYGLYDDAIKFYTEIVDENSNGAIEGYKRLAYIYEMLGEYEKELEIIQRFYQKKYRSVGKYTKDEFVKRTRNLNKALGTSYTIDDFIHGNVNQNRAAENNDSYSNLSNDEKIFKFADMYEKGLLTREEFEMKKKELL